jgi:23S rRNA pseudouridine1911/1915/1917 synthase
VNQGFTHRWQVDRTATGHTLLSHLTEHYPHSTEDVWRTRITDGEVLVDGTPAPTDARLRPGQHLAWNRPPWEEPPVPLAFAVLHRDAHLLAVAKPRGLPAVPNGGFLTHTLLHLVRAQAPDATPMHRLGRGTSGIVLFALTAEARRGIASAWREGRVDKEYRALASGLVDAAAFSIDTPIGLVPHPRLGRVFAAVRDGKASLSHVRALGVRSGNTIVDVRIPTGRPHQIRIHLAAAGHPLVGDPLYAAGGMPREDPGLPGDAGYRLHAHRLGFAHPIHGRRVEIECAPPRELRLE